MKKLLTGILASTLLLSTLGTSFALETTQNPEQLQQIHTETLSSGTCGDNVTWSFDANTGHLQISGSGAMYDYFHTAGWTDDLSPWNSFETSIKTVDISNGVTGIGSAAFMNATSLTSVHIPDTVTTIPLGAFENCTSLVSVNIPSSITEIQWGAFSNCRSLPSIQIPNSVLEIHLGAFESCHSLTTVTIPDSVTSIGDGAFADCVSLTTAYIPDSLTSTIGQHAFVNCPVLTDIYFGGSESRWTEIGTFTMAGATFHENNDDDEDYEEYDFHHVNFHYNFQASSTPEPTPDVTPDTTPEPSPEPTFPDWATKYTDYVYPSIMPDMTSTNYDNGATRGTIAAYLYNLAGNGVVVSATKDFNDLGDYANAIAWCDANGIMNGMSDDYFGTDLVVEREQFALTLRQLATHLGKNTSANSDSANGFGDSWSISVWAKEGVAWAVEQSLMSGYEGNLDPHAGISKVQVAVMLYNFNNL